MAEGAVSKQPDVICSSAIGSCVVIALYETRARIGGLAHIMLPEISRKEMRKTPFQCADTGIASLIEWMRGEGAEMKYIAAKIVGGARMFSYYQSNPNIGERNIKCVKQVLRKKGIPLIGEDVGGSCGRSVKFHLDSGKLIIRSTGREKKVI
ncbi:chemotaxis protein CheD [groundwater metagenome]